MAKHRKLEPARNPVLPNRPPAETTAPAPVVDSNHPHPIVLAHRASSTRGTHRRQDGMSIGGRAAAATLAAGALMTVGATATASAETHSDHTAATDIAGNPVAEALAASPGLLTLPPLPDLGPGPDQVATTVQAELDRIARDHGVGVSHPRAYAPTNGTLTSGFGARWGAQHNGIDLASPIGTPIVSVADGTVLESGPASGFGLWVRILQDDGTVGVYGHVNESFVTAGQQVQAGEQIATVGNRGESSGPHLHYEVWTPDGEKIDPMPWLNARGVQLG